MYKLIFRHSNHGNFKQKNINTGFTLIEIIVVISVIGLLASVSVISYGGWQKSIIATTLKNDLISLSASMENVRNFDNIYPSAIPENFTPSDGVVLTGGSKDGGKTYCVNATSTKDLSIKYYIVSNSGNRDFQPGSCSLSSPAPTPDVPTFPIVVNPPVAGVIPVNPPTKVHCNAGDPEYHFRYRINDSSDWITPGAWDPDESLAAYSLSTQQGKKYGLQMQARCNQLGDFSETLNSPEVSVIADITTVPNAPVVAVNTVAATTTYSWNAPVCVPDTTVRYQYRYTITPSGYDSGLVSTTTNSVAFTTSTEGQTYTVVVQAQCYSDNTASAWSVNSNSGSYTAPAAAPASPSIPSITIALMVPNVNATITTPSTCVTGTAQYGIRSRTDDGSWSAYSAWSTGLTAFRAGSVGVKYGYQAQARCYVDAGNISSTVTSVEATYVYPIPIPAAPVVTANTVATTTTYSWTTPTCSSGTTVRLTYQHTITPSGYDSGVIATASSSLVVTTSTDGETYTVAVRAECYNSITRSGWSTAGSASYTVSTVIVDIPAPAKPTITALVAGATSVKGTITPVTCTTGTPQYGIRVQINNLAWSDYSTWSTSLIRTQSTTSAPSGTYHFQAQARCYLNDTSYSAISTGREDTVNPAA